MLALLDDMFGLVIYFYVKMFYFLNKTKAIDFSFCVFSKIDLRTECTYIFITNFDSLEIIMSLDCPTKRSKICIQ